MSLGAGVPAGGQLCPPQFTWAPPILPQAPETVHCPVSMLGEAALGDRVSCLQADGRPSGPLVPTHHPQKRRFCPFSIYCDLWPGAPTGRGVRQVRQTPLCGRWPDAAPSTPGTSSGLEIPARARGHKCGFSALPVDTALWWPRSLTRATGPFLFGFFPLILKVT